MSRKLLSLVLVLGLVLGAVSVVSAQDPVTVQWFVGLGSGGQDEQIAAQESVVEEFNATHDAIQIELIIVNNDVAYDTLSTLIATGDAPDIVGPVGIKGSNAYTGSWLDLQPVIDEVGYDLSQFPEAAVDFYRDPVEGLIGLPFGSFPSFIFFNRDLFDEAGLDYPPNEWGAPYADGDEWNIDKLTEVAMLLTVDANGNDATMDEFDPENIVQFGFHTAWTDPRGMATMFGSGNFADADGNAIIPDNWRAAFHWYYDAMWNKYFYPNDSYANSDMLANGNPFSSGHVAMAASHLWYTCCLGEAATVWDAAAMPSYEGVITAKLHADTFRILKMTDNPKEAFEVLSYLIGDAAPQLLAVYGGMPLDPEAQSEYFAALDETFTQGVDWDTVIAGLDYPDNPNHEANMPNFNKANERIGAFQTLIQGTPGLDIDAELDTLKADLQAIFDEVK